MVENGGISTSNNKLTLNIDSDHLNPSPSHDENDFSQWKNFSPQSKSPCALLPSMRDAPTPEEMNDKHTCNNINKEKETPCTAAISNSTRGRAKVANTFSKNSKAKRSSTLPPRLTLSSSSPNKGPSAVLTEPKTPPSFSSSFNKLFNNHKKTPPAVTTIMRDTSNTGIHHHHGPALLSVAVIDDGEAVGNSGNTAGSRFTVHHSLSNMSRERKEDDHPPTLSESSAMPPPPVRSTKPSSESGRARGATPPRPVMMGGGGPQQQPHRRNRSNEGLIPVIGSSTANGPATTVNGAGTGSMGDMPQQPSPQLSASAQKRRSSSLRRRSASPNRIPRIPNKQSTSATTIDASGTTASQTSSPHRFPNNKDHNNTSSCHQSIASSGGGSMSKLSASRKNLPAPTPPYKSKTNKTPHPADHEQALFEQRLCEDPHGVAVRKINQNGKPNLRYVRCIVMESPNLDTDTMTIGGDSHNNSTTYPASAKSSVSSFTRSFRKSSGSPINLNHKNNNQEHSSSSRVRALSWGKKKDVRIPLDRFVCVRKGKTTDRSRRNASPACRILSLVTNSQSLDIEAPTRLDRDKFARAFARFLEVPLMSEDNTAESLSPRPEHVDSHQKVCSTRGAISEPDLASSPKKVIAEAKLFKQQQQQCASPRQHQQHNAPLPVVMAATNGTNNNNISRNQQQVIDGQAQVARTEQPVRTSATSSLNNPASASAKDSSPYSNSNAKPMNDSNQKVQIASLPSSLRDCERSSTQAATASRPTHPEHDGSHDGDDVSHISSLTGAGFDQEIVEELHQALTELRVELEESRAEAARAVKVAEQAIQSAENSSSNDWNSTVTHKAAEAAALAQKKSAEAMAKQRLAEERLDGERRTAAFWRRQAEAAEEELGALQTRAASAEVQRAAIAEELECERRKTAAMLEAMNTQCSPAELRQKETVFEETLSSESSRSGPRMKLGIMGRKKRNHEEDDPSALAKLLPQNSRSSSSSVDGDGVFGLDHVSGRPDAVKISHGFLNADSEVALLREKLALESAARRKLLHEVQDLRGVVRVYCRPRICPANTKSILSIPSQETLLLQPFENESPMTFKFDRVFTPDVQQREVYNEIEELCLSVLEGYNICLMAHGQRGTGKTYSMFGDVVYKNEAAGGDVNVEVKDYGIHLRTAEQLFSIAQQRKERYQDVFTLEIVEVHNERLHDLVAGTEIGETLGQLVMEDAKSSSRRSKRGSMSEDGSAAGPPQPSNSHSVSSKQGSTMAKLEIRTNHNGDTVVQGLLSVEVHNFDDVQKLWHQCLSQRATRLADQGVDITDYEASSHVIATLSVASTNLATGMGSVGRIKFVDLAGADLVQRRNCDGKMSVTPDFSAEKNMNIDWKYSNRSLATLNDVVNCRSQYMRNVPYRNSTLTHLLRDNLEADTKVLLLLCVSANPKDLQETACALRFAAGMRRVTIGKATKHSLTR